MDIVVSKGDFGKAINFTCKQSDGSVYDLTGYTVTLYYWTDGSSSSATTLGTCTVDTATSGTCHYTVQDGDFDTAGDYLAVLRLTATGVQDTLLPYNLHVEDAP